MRTHFLNIVWFAASCMIVPANAETNWSGYGELSGGGGASMSHQACSGVESWYWHCNAESSSTSTTPWTLVGDAHVNAALDADWSFQLDAEAQDVRDANLQWTYDSNGITKYGIGLHLDATGEQYRIGYLVSIGNSDLKYANNRFFSAGLESAWFFDRTTVFSQLIHSHAIQGDGAGRGLGSWYLYTGARHFLRDNLMLEADAAAGSMTDADRGGGYRAFSSSDNGNVLHWSAKAEYRFEQLPVSVGLSYLGTYLNWHRYEAGGYPASGCIGPSLYSLNSAWRRTDTLFMVTLRYYFGRVSLIDNDRHGAGMNDYNPWYGAEAVMEGETRVPGIVVPAAVGTLSASHRC